MSGLVKELFMGFCLGTANIIPGVSGGTFLLVFQIYERVFSIVNQINKSFVLRLIRLGLGMVKEWKKGKVDFGCFLRDTDFIFLLKLGVGAVIAVLALSSLMKYLLVHHFSVTYSLFFGLILVSVIIPVRLVHSYNGSAVFFALLGLCLTIGITWMVNPYDKVKAKSDSYHGQYVKQHGIGRDPGVLNRSVSKPADDGISQKGSGFLDYTGQYTMDEYFYAWICGAVSISAMVLPGISGSLVLILMGAYFDVISAVSALKYGSLDTLVFLGCFGLGVIAGGLLFARLISFVLNRFYNGTMSFLAGLMAGSLYALWPFKQVAVLPLQYVKENGNIVVLENTAVYTNQNILPQHSDPLFLCLVFFLAGCVLMHIFVRADSGEKT